MRSPAVRLMFLPVVLGISDAVVTLRCQPPEYWESYGFDHLIEANPIARLVLGIHPLLLVPGFIVWFGVIWLVTFRTPAWIGLRCHVIFVAGPLIALTGAAIRFAEHPWPRIAALLLIGLFLAAVMLRPFLSQWNSPARLRDPGSDR